MSFGALNDNIANEKEILREVAFYMQMLKAATSSEQRVLLSAISSLGKQFSMLNDSIPDVLQNISIARALPSAAKEAAVPKDKKIISISFKNAELQKRSAVIKGMDKEKFIRELGITDELIKKLKAGKAAEKIIVRVGRVRASLYAILANKFFSGTANRIIAKGYFKNINMDLKKASIPVMLNTYISMMFFSVSAVFLLSLIAFISLLAVYISSPDVLKFLWMIFFAPLIAFAIFYFYPSGERKSAEKRINDELPFVAIHMSAIAGSGLEPTNIFRVINQSRENPYTSREIRKLLNMINFYGMDLVSALRDTARLSPNKKLSELFNGLATTISTGGSLTEFLDKRAETLLFDFKLEKENNTKMAETFMDIYISVAIAAPMMLVLLMVLMGISGISTFFTNPTFMAVAIVMAISLINIIFLMFLHIKQPKIS